MNTGVEERKRRALPAEHQRGADGELQMSQTASPSRSPSPAREQSPSLFQTPPPESPAPRGIFLSPPAPAPPPPPPSPPPPAPAPHSPLPDRQSSLCRSPPRSQPPPPASPPRLQTPSPIALPASRQEPALSPRLRRELQGTETGSLDDLDNVGILDWPDASGQGLDEAGMLDQPSTGTGAIRVPVISPGLQPAIQEMLEHDMNLDRPGTDNRPEENGRRQEPRPIAAAPTSAPSGRPKPRPAYEGAPTSQPATNDITDPPVVPAPTSAPSGRPKPRSANKGLPPQPVMREQLDISSWPQHVIDAYNFLVYVPSHENGLKEMRNWCEDWQECVQAFFEFLKFTGFSVSKHY